MTPWLRRPAPRPGASCLAAAALAGAGGALQGPGAVQERALSEPPLRVLATEHLGRWTGTAAAPLEASGLAGTDLGVSFERDGRLLFLFGDSWTLDRRDWDVDSAALAPLRFPEGGALPRLDWLRGEGGRFLGLRPGGLALGGMEVPVEGLAAGPTTYVFFDRGWDARRRRHSRSVLARADGLDLAELRVVHDVESARFLNVSVVVEEETAWIFGSGAYRASDVFLARVPLAAIEDREAWRYAPAFGPGEESAEPIVACGCAGELSVRRHAALGLWLMTYNCGSPRGILLRAARDPAGPWSEALSLFDPARPEDRGYGHFLHQACGAVGYDDGLSEPGREDEWGGEYGPYLVPAWFREPAPGLHGIVYALSSWNPYQVHLLCTWLAEPSYTGARAPARAAPARGGALKNPRFADGKLDGWTSAGDRFALGRMPAGGFELSTFTPEAGDAARGSLWQDFVVPAEAAELRFRVRGGTAAVELRRGDELLRATRGRRTNDAEVLARWRLESLRGERVRLVIRDDQAGPWGFVTAREFELVE